MTDISSVTYSKIIPSRGIGWAKEGRSREDILLQISAIKAAINKVGVVVLEDYLENCIGGCNCREPDAEVIDKMKKAIHKLVN